ncbi:MAG TPA: HDIG domain-containing protein, partial [Spirochaetota bacterium]
MLGNIRAHSERVAQVAVAIVDNLREDCHINRELVCAGALLHDITKTRALQTGEHHDHTGGDFIRSMGLY